MFLQRWLSRLGWAVCVCLASVSSAVEPSVTIERVIPPQGIELTSADRQPLIEALTRVEARRDAVAQRLDETAQALLIDVDVLTIAVAKAIEFDEFFAEADVSRATRLLEVADERLGQLAAGGANWSAARGCVARGFRSKLDDSIQPYGLVIPEKLDLSRPCPMYVWLHGRGDTKTEVGFLDERLSKPGTLEMEDGVVLHPFGRYCNAYKFAGETDVFEAIAAAQAAYEIDPRRIVLCGFSMGGAGAWHLGAHHADRWAGVHCGAGFAETARYQKIPLDRYPAWYEVELWRLYDVPNYVRNLFNVPVLAYSGEIDKQIQAARVMEEAFAEHSRSLPHLIGPGMGHKYHPDALTEVRRRLSQFARQGSDPFPRQVTLQTRTLRYNRQYWVEVLALDRHWADARVDATRVNAERMAISTTNVAALKLRLPPLANGETRGNLRVRINQSTVVVPGERISDDELILARGEDGWRMVDGFPAADSLVKRHGLQGPIDDVLYEPFLIVRPSGACADEDVDAWVRAEMAHFDDRWRRLFRGEVRHKLDREVTSDDLETYHLIVWGDATANQLLAEIAHELPIGWTTDTISATPNEWPAAGNVLRMICPNPKASSRYVVLNGAITFCEAHDATNSQQTPKLPDWAVIDVREHPTASSRGRVVRAGFFDERWKVRADEAMTD